MSKIEALIGSLIVGLGLALGLVLWVGQDGHWDDPPRPQPVPSKMPWLTEGRPQWMLAKPLVQQEPPAPLPAPSEDDPHAGQPEHCTNAKDAPKAHKCACKKSAEACDVEDKACKVYCRKDKCYCWHGECDS